MISVIMPFYNAERYITRSVLSILCQNYKNIELILIDDGSTDSSAEIVSRIKDDRIVFLKQKNKGLTKSLNIGLSISRGDYIARHDADDFSIFNRFEKQIQILEEDESLSFLGSSCFIQPENHGIVNEVFSYPENTQDINNAFTTYNPFVHGSIVIRKKVLEKFGGYNEEYRYVQDYELWSRIIPYVKSINLKDPLYVRSVHSNASEMIVNKKPIFDEIKTGILKNIASIWMA